MIKLNEIINLNATIKNKKATHKLINDFLVSSLGFVLAVSNTTKDILPFGIAFIPCGGIPGLIGVLLGTWIRGEDVFRYVVASILNYISFKYLKELLAIPKEITAFMTALWSILISGILGLFIVKTSFTENCFFALSGVLSGLFSYIFLIYKDVFTRKYKVKLSRIEYICALATIAVVIASFYNLGKIGEISASIIAFLCIFVVSSSNGLLSSFSFATVVGFALVLSDDKNLIILAILIFGTIISSIISPLGKYSTLIAYTISAIINCIYFREEQLPVSQLFNIAAAGVIFLMIPKTVYKTIKEVLIPQSEKPRKNIRKRKIKKHLPLKHKSGSDYMSKTCEKCKNKFFCWVKDYGYTSEVFEDFRQGLKKGEEAFPAHFKSKCENTEKIATELKSEILNKIGYTVEYAKCSEAKAGETVCGDSCCIFNSNGRQILCIADGMGSGPFAAKESIKSSRLIENLIRNGVSKEDAIKIINDTLIKSDCESVLAIDISVIDLQTGICEFVKAGAAPTYVIRNGNLYELGSKSVPIGILDELNLEYERSKLLNDDVIIMVSDGMVSDGAEWLGLLVQSMSDLEIKSPLLLADNIMSTAKRLKKNIMDDLTVITAKISLG